MTDSEEAPRPGKWKYEAPLLLVVVDTEEEFNWGLPFDRQATATHSITAQDRVHGVYDKLGVVPTYVMDYPVAASRTAAHYLRTLVDAGKAEFGTHCHPWVTPPYSEQVSVFNSYHGNLPRELEAEKIRLTTEAVAQAFGRSPRVFKAGRYGLGPNTFGILRELGYSVDCSVVPHTSFAHEGGPNYQGMPDQPYFPDASHALLEVPLTVGYSGSLRRWGVTRPALMQNHFAQRLHLPGIMSRMGLLERVRLSPEGFDENTLKRLLRTMVQDGVQVFTMTYHSPTLQPGNTPYVRTPADLEAFLRTIENVLRYFQSELGGRFSTLERLERLIRVQDSRARAEPCPLETGSTLAPGHQG
ncbi:polysaccharide deacetylase family protein [Hydrogenophaga sp. BPS33]|uniref:polysaccharide deacetylase family protein n=1 Tax=Hydrogenophaga sp. BPS33 TaxID=2651974 RepID=UPI00131F8A44|nr:polysaccharide deacetylase family protein [Hydrogenophaga sp. BPS33]QHE85940.1 glycosyltransferase [Hydrogenophaga sp. BPS33]